MLGERISIWIRDAFPLGITRSLARFNLYSMSLLLFIFTQLELLIALGLSSRESMMIPSEREREREMVQFVSSILCPFLFYVRSLLFIIYDYVLINNLFINSIRMATSILGKNAKAFDFCFRRKGVFALAKAIDGDRP